MFLCHFLVPWPSIDIRRKSYGDCPWGTPLSGALNARGVAKDSDLDLLKTLSRKWCKIGGKLVLITNRKLYMSFELVPKSVTLNAIMDLILPYFTEFVYNVVVKKFTFALSSGEFLVSCYRYRCRDVQSFNLKKTLYKSLSVAQIAERFEPNTVLWAFHTIQPSAC